jgi:eukaryotic-like serine/threonine-protein kinase
MSNTSWQRVKEVFEAARALPASERRTFLDGVCDEDQSLRSEVEKLLASYDSDFLEDNVLGAVEALADPGLAAGQAIGRYRIGELIGTGGMGKVYKADDTELDRPVAFKVLHRDVADDGERVRRFIQEAKAASALNHPNILTIHEIGSFEGARFIVSEFVDGETLREKMRSGISAAQSLDIACQIGAALDAAHAAGIVHRDIKPENVMIRRRDGLVKVLDFGLAKLTEADDRPIDATASPSLIQTSPGLVMGTVAYMSPEQARGQSVDARTDLWSLGVVLHEMLTGTSPFEGESVTELLSSIIEKGSVPLRTESLPPQMLPICRKALAKDKDSRYRSAQDLLADLEGEKKRMEYAIQPSPYVSAVSTDDLKTQLIRPKPTLSAEYLVTSVKRHKYATLGALLTVAVIAAGLTVYRYNAAPSRSSDGVFPVIVDSTTASELKMARLPTSGSVDNIAISPDGRYIAYTTRDGAGKGGIRLREREGGSDIEIVAPPTTGSYWALTFSPASDQLLYALGGLGYTRGQLFRLPLRGGEAVRIQAENTDSGASMSPDGKTIAFMTEKGTDTIPRELIVSSTDGTDQRVLVHTEGSGGWIDCGPTPTWAPDGKSLVCWKAEKVDGEEFLHLYAISVADGKMNPLGDKKWNRISGATYMPNGSLVIAARDHAGEQSTPSQLWLINSSGEAKRITNDLTGYQTLSATRSGNIMVSLRTTNTTDLWLMSGKDASQPHRVTNSGEEISEFRWTQNGKILFTSSVSGNPDIWIMNPDGSGRKQLTKDNGSNLDASMTRDLRYIVYINGKDFGSGRGHVFRMDSDGRNIKQLSNGPHKEWTPRLSPDGKWVYYVEVSMGSQRICKISIDGGEPITLARVNHKLTIFDVSSKDGSILLDYRPQGDAVRHVVILSPEGKLADGATGWPRSAVKFDLPSSARGTLRFTPDGKYVAFRDFKDGKAYAVSAIPVSGKGRPKVLFPLEEGFQGVRWSPDGKQLANVKRSVMSEGIVITNSGN